MTKLAISSLVLHSNFCNVKFITRYNLRPHFVLLVSRVYGIFMYHLYV
jgi:hypothetical protein